jgi:hypothetical protein
MARENDTEVSPPPAAAGRLPRQELRLRGWLLQAVGASLGCAGGALGLWGIEALLEQQIAGSWLASIVGGTLVYLGVNFFLKGRRAAAPSVEDTTSEDARPPVLYLRGFKDDAESERERVVGFGFDAFHALSAATSEEALRRYFSDRGPLIGLAWPEETVPTGGAARTWLVHAGPAYWGPEGWKRWVIEYLQCSQLAVMNWNATPSASLRWELDTAMAMLGPGRVLLWFPQRGDWEAFRNDPPLDLGAPLPEQQVLLLGFTEALEPRVVETGDGQLRAPAMQTGGAVAQVDASQDDQPAGPIARFFRKQLRAESDFTTRR